MVLSECMQRITLEYLDNFVNRAILVQGDIFILWYQTFSDVYEHASARHFFPQGARKEGTNGSGRTIKMTSDRTQ